MTANIFRFNDEQETKLSTGALAPFSRIEFRVIEAITYAHLTGEKISNREIAAAAGVDVDAVNKHTASIYTKVPPSYKTDRAGLIKFVRETLDLKPIEKPQLSAKEIVAGLTEMEARLVLVVQKGARDKDRISRDLFQQSGRNVNPDTAMHCLERVKKTVGAKDLNHLAAWAMANEQALEQRIKDAGPMKVFQFIKPEPLPVKPKPKPAGRGAQNAPAPGQAVQ